MKHVAGKKDFRGSQVPSQKATTASRAQHFRRQNEELRQEIAQLQATNQSLSDSEQRLRLAIATGDIGLWVWNSTDITNAGDWSPRLKEIFGLPPDTEVTHEMFLNQVHPEDRERVNSAIMAALCRASGGKYQSEYRVLRQSDGTLRWVTARGQAFFDAQDIPVRFIGTVMDITERKLGEMSVERLNAELERRVGERTLELARSNRALHAEIEERQRAEENLRLSEAYLAEAQRLSRTGSFGWNVATGELVWSEETFCILGYPRTIRPNLDMVFERIHPEDAAFVRQTLERGADLKTHLDFEHRLLMPDGSVKHLHVLAKPAGLDRGTLEYVGAVMDITEKKKGEEALRNSERLARGQTEALMEALDALARESSADRIIEHVLRTIITQLSAHSCSVWLKDEGTELMNFEFALEGGEFKTKSDATLAAVSPPRGIQDIWPWPEIFRTGKSYVLEDIRKAPVPDFPWRAHVLAQGVICILTVPMLIAGSVRGVIGIRFTRTRSFRPDEIELAQALAHQATLAVELSRIAAQSRQTAVLAERNRLARDIHDTLAQGFTGVIMQLQAAKGAATHGDVADAAVRIERAEELARTSLGEARRSVRALRPRSLRDGTLCAALADLLKRMSIGTNLQAEFRVAGKQRAMSVAWEEGLLRIVQESLTNTIKHAQARHFSATLTFEAEQIKLQLADDGRGFNIHADHDGFGIIGMSERVEQLGGRFSIYSEKEGGTKIFITSVNSSEAKLGNENDHG